MKTVPITTVRRTLASGTAPAISNGMIASTSPSAYPTVLKTNTSTPPNSRTSPDERRRNRPLSVVCVSSAGGVPAPGVPASELIRPPSATGSEAAAAQRPSLESIT